MDRKLLREQPTPIRIGIGQIKSKQVIRNCKFCFAITAYTILQVKKTTITQNNFLIVSDTILWGLKKLKEKNVVASYLQ